MSIPPSLQAPSPANVQIESDTLLRRNTLAIVMGGGAGTRLFPLTENRAKPAVPLAGKYRIVDIPIGTVMSRLARARAELKTRLAALKGRNTDER